MKYVKNYVIDYVNFLKRYLDAKRPLRIILDCSNGTTGFILRNLKIKNCKLKIINEKPDGRFPAHGPDPSKPGALNQLSRAVQKNRADLGVAFDADGDRAFFVDEKGKPITSFVIAHLLFLNSRPPFVADVFIFEALKYAGLLPPKTFPSQVGLYFLKQKMLKHRARLGAEYSGHYYHQDFYSLDSALLTAIKVINAVSRLPYPLSQFKNLLPRKLSTQLINFRTGQPRQFLAVLERRYRPQAKKVSKIDGVTLEFEKGWLTARASNTEPLVRVFIGKVL